MEAKPAPASRAGQTALGFCQSLALVVLALSLLLHLAWQHRVFELMCHFRLQYAVSALALAALFALFRAWRWLGVALATFILNAAVIAPLYLAAAPATPAQSTSLRLMTVNVLTSNSDSKRLVELIRRERPDAFVCLEVNARWLADLQPLRELYPHVISEPQEMGNFGIALFSREPLLDASIVLFGGIDEVPSIRAAIERDGKRLSIVATHPLPPVWYFEERNLHLQALAGFLSTIKGRVAVMGDLNATMWSPHFQNFVAESALRDSRQGFGVLASWPAGVAHMRIPIDHCLLRGELSVSDCRLGPNIGSDHLPLITDIVM